MTRLEKRLSKLEQIISKSKPLYQFLKKCKVGYQKAKYNLLKFTHKEKDIMYNREFFDKNLEWNVPIASKMVDIFIKYFRPKSVVDMGCGNAEFLCEFEKSGIVIRGYEGSNCALEKALVKKEFIELLDLRNRIISSEKYDLVLCLEVAEHIETKFSKRLVENLTGLGDTIVFTAAPPGQGGHFHMNEQPGEFWISIFKEMSFLFDSVTTEKIKSEMEESGIIRWYRENLMIFKKL